MKKRLSLTTGLCLSFILFATGCQGISGSVAYQPPLIPIKIVIDSDRSIRVEASTDVVTPIGVFSATLSVDPSQYLGETNAKNTLTIRLNGQDSVYDLHGQPHQFDFESGYYKQIRISGPDTNMSWLIILDRIADAPQVVQENNLPDMRTAGCPGEPPVQFSADMTVQVSPGLPNRLRASPGLSGAFIMSVPSGTNLVILDGPVCRDNYGWWHVSDGGIQGWTADGEGSEYWLIPAN